LNKIWKHTIDICYDEETGIKKRILISILLILIGIGVMIWFIIRLLIFEDYWNPSYNINLSAIGQVGDFIGGFSGTLFALVGVVLLFETLALQRTELGESRKVFEKQQFENTFFNLLNLYQEVTKSMHFDNFDFYSEKTYSGKEFFEQQKKKFYEEFTPQNDFSKNRKEASLKYIIFYTSTKEQTSHYFRTLYRIFSFISNSTFDSKEKMSYAKIVRAQLSESELFFIHYNAYTEYGNKFRQLINEFNIIKHLPVLEKVEYKNYIGNYEYMELNGLSLVLDDLKSFIKTLLLDQKEKYKTYLQGSIAIKTTSTSSSNFKLTIIKKDNVTLNNSYQQGFGLDKFDINTMEQFFKDYLIDMVSFSNYFELNGKEINLTCIKNTNTQLQKHTIEITVSKKNNKPIKIL
jgi:hypothetical protein